MSHFIIDIIEVRGSLSWFNVLTKLFSYLSLSVYLPLSGRRTFQTFKLLYKWMDIKPLSLTQSYLI